MQFVTFSKVRVLHVPDYHILCVLQVLTKNVNIYVSFYKRNHQASTYIPGMNLQNYIAILSNYSTG